MGHWYTVHGFTAVEEDTIHGLIDAAVRMTLAMKRNGVPDDVIRAVLLDILTDED